MLNNIHDMDTRFELGNSLMVSGPSKAGKTSWVVKLIKYRDELFKEGKENINKIYWFYGTWQPVYDTLRREYNIILQNGISESEANEIEPKSIVVIDDLVKETENSAHVTALFTRQVHHSKLFLIYINQNFFHQSREARMRHLNCHFILLFKNPRDKTQPAILAKQMFPDRSPKEFVIV